MIAKDFSDACKHWYPIILVLHRFFIAISRTVVNDDGRGGGAGRLILWSGLLVVSKSVGDRLKRLGTTLCCLVHRGSGLEVGFAGLVFTSLRMMFQGGLSRLGKLAAFLSSLTWPSEVADLGAGGISYVELLILYERWAGERLRIEESYPEVPEAWASNFCVSCTPMP